MLVPYYIIYLVGDSMNLNKRLRKVAELIPDNSSMLDIGCDHALLDIYLAQDKNRKFNRIVASDNKTGPLNKARENVRKYKVQDMVELRLGDGLEAYSDDIDTIVISGMGGRSMIGIFKYAMKKLKKVNTIVLSPNNYQVDIKTFLTKNGYIIDDEILIKEGKITYQIIRFVKGKKRYSKKELYFGPVLLKNKNTLFYEYYTKELASKHIISKIVPKGHFRYKLKLKKEIKMLQEVLGVK